MASRAELARVAGQLREAAPGRFRDYVQTIAARRDAAIHNLLYAATHDECLRGEARAYDTLLNDIMKNEAP